MRKLLLSGTLLLLATGGVVEVAKKHLNVENLSVSQKGVDVGLVEVKFGGYRLTAGGLKCNFEKRECSISSLAVTAPPPGIKTAPPLPPFPVGKLSDYLNLTAKALNKFNWKVNVGTVFFYQEPVSVNLYRVLLRSGSFELGTLQVFNGPNETFEGSLSLFTSTRSDLKENNSGLSLSLNAIFEVPAALKRGNLTARWNGEFLSLESKLVTPSGTVVNLKGQLLPLNDTLKGVVFYSLPQREIEGKIFATFDGYRLNADGTVKGKPFYISYRLDYPLYRTPKVVYNGNASGGCAGNFTFGGDFYGNLLRIGFTSSSNLYGAAAVQPTNGGVQLWGFLTQGGKGFTTFEGGFKNGAPLVGILFQNATFDLCGIFLKGLEGDVNYQKGILKDSLTFEELDYGNGTVRVGSTRVKLHYDVENFRGTLLLKGSLRGLVYARDGRINAPAIGGEILFKEKPLNFDLERLFLSLPVKNSTEEKIRFAGLIRGLSLDGNALRNVALRGVFDEKEKNLHLRFKRNWEGTLSVDLKTPFPYRVNLAGKVYPRGGGEATFTLKGKGSLKRGSLGGKVSLHPAEREKPLSFAFNADYRNTPSYKSANFTLNTLTAGESLPSVNLRGWATLRGRNNPQLRGKISTSAVFGKFKLSPVAEIEGKPYQRRFHLRVSPFGVIYDGLTLLKFKGMEIDYNQGRLNFGAETFKGYPLSVNLRGDFDTRTLTVENLKGTLGVKSDFIDVYTVPFYTALPPGRYITVYFSYKGPLKELPYGLNLNMNEVLPLWTAYTYKPVELFLNLFNDNGTYQLFVGMQDNSTGEVFGTAQAAFNVGNRTANLSWNLGDFPLRAFYDGVFHSYLKVGSDGSLSVKPRNGKGKGENPRGYNISLNTTVSVGGYVKIDSYKFPSSGNGEGGTTNSTNTLSYNVSIDTPSGLYLQTPNGEFLVYLNGEISDNSTRRFDVSIAYGKLNLFGKTFYVSGGRVMVNGGQTYVDIPLTLYAPERTVYIRVYGYLPWQNLKLDIHSVPPAPEDQLLLYIISGGGSAAGGGVTQLPIAQEILAKAASLGVVNLLNRISSSLIGGVEIDFVPSVDPTQGLVMGVRIQKYIGDLAKVGYYWSFSNNPKATYMWGSLRLLGGFFRVIRYSDGSKAAVFRFSGGLGNPY